MLTVLIMLFVEAATGRRQRAEAQRVIAIDESRRAARAIARADALDAATRELQAAITAVHHVHHIPDSPERDRLARASGDLDRVRDAARRLDDDGRDSRGHGFGADSLGR